MDSNATDMAFKAVFHMYFRGDCAVPVGHRNGYTSSDLNAIASIQIMPASSDRLIALAGNHRVILQHLGGGLWRTHIGGAHTADFQNVYSSCDEAKADAALFVEMEFWAWQLPVPEAFQWVEA
jgi:hypothetical protein